MSLLLIILIFNLNKKKPLFDFEIVILNLFRISFRFYNIEKNKFFF